jgi:hypothetical protein
MAKIIDEVEMKIISGVARERALAHTTKVLEYKNFLCECIRSRVDFSGGSLYSTDLATCGFDQIENFAWGTGAGHDAGIAGRLFASLSMDNNRVMVMDDVMGDLITVYPSSIIHDGEVYHWVTASNVTIDELSGRVWAASVSWHFVGAIFSRQMGADIPQCIGDGKCAELGDIVEVIVGAYDGEGFIHWTPA